MDGGSRLAFAAPLARQGDQREKGNTMPDYGKQKSGRGVKGQPRHSEHNAPGGAKNPYGNRPDKAALLAKLTQKAQEKAGKTDPEG